MLRFLWELYSEFFEYFCRIFCGLFSRILKYPFRIVSSSSKDCSQIPLRFIWKILSSESFKNEFQNPPKSPLEPSEGFRPTDCSQNFQCLSTESYEDCFQTFLRSFLRTFPSDSHCLQKPLWRVNWGLSLYIYIFWLLSPDVCDCCDD